MRKDTHDQRSFMSLATENGDINNPFIVDPHDDVYNQHLDAFLIDRTLS